MGKTQIQQPVPDSAVVSASDYVVIGGTGDLSVHKILPALFRRYLAGQVTDGFRVVSAALGETTRDEYAGMIRPFCLGEKADRARVEAFGRFMELVRPINLDVASGDGAAGLAALLGERYSESRPVIFYLAVAPSLFSSACRTLKEHSMVVPQARLVVEKPLGHDGASAAAIDGELRDVFLEENIYRIDHYLGKETVQNLMALRFANTIFENQWNHEYIDHVQITVAETAGLDGRGEYYDRYGALRDMVQNHLMQLVCLVAMQPPPRIEADLVRNEKVRVLNSLVPVTGEDIAKHLVIGQYGGYRKELGKESATETFVALKLFIGNMRWAEVPFYLRTGKRMPSRASEIIVNFKRRKHDVFGLPREENHPNRLVIRLQPEEGLRLQMTAKEPGPGGIRLFPTELELSFGWKVGELMPDAYERLLMDVARGNQTLFMRNDEVMAAWKFMDPIIEAAAGMEPEIYKPDTWGPDSQNCLFGDGGGWITPRSDWDES